jgi:hypothetical protein
MAVLFTNLTASLVKEGLFHWIPDNRSRGFRNDEGWGVIARRTKSDAAI